MAISDISLVKGSERTDASKWGYGFRIKGGSGTNGAGGDNPGEIWLVWKTDFPYNSSMHDKVHIAVAYEGIPKGSLNGGHGYGIRSDKQEFVAAATVHGNVTGDCLWGVNLADFLPSGWFGSSWKFEDRSYDQIHLLVKIYVKYPEGTTDETGSDKSPQSSRDLWIGYIPKYSLTGMSFSSTKTIQITYEAPGWTRRDDRFAIESFKKGTTELLIRKQWGDGAEIDVPGYVPVAMSYLSAPPEPNDSIYAKVRFNAQYREADLEFATAEATLTLEQEYTFDGPNPDFTITDDGRLIISDETSYQEVYFAIDGPGWEFDEFSMEVSAGEMAGILNFPPIGVDFYVNCTQGSPGLAEGEWEQSDVNTKHVFIPAEGRCLIDPYDPATGGSAGKQCVLKGDLEFEFSAAADGASRKLSGRDEATVLFGNGEVTTATLRGKTIDALGSPLSDWMELRRKRLAVVRLPDGQRYVMGVMNVSIRRTAQSRAYDVTLTLVETRA